MISCFPLIIVLRDLTVTVRVAALTILLNTLSTAARNCKNYRFSNAPNSNFSPNSTVISTQLCRIVVCWCPHADACSMLHYCHLFLDRSASVMQLVMFACMSVLSGRVTQKTTCQINLFFEQYLLHTTNNYCLRPPIR